MGGSKVQMNVNFGQVGGKRFVNIYRNILTLSQLTFFHILIFQIFEGVFFLVFKFIKVILYILKCVKTQKMLPGGQNSNVNFFLQVGGQPNANDCKLGMGGWSKCGKLCKCKLLIPFHSSFERKKNCQIIPHGTLNIFLTLKTCLDCTQAKIVCSSLIFF